MCWCNVTAASLCCQPCVSTICLPPSRPFATQPTGDPPQALVDHYHLVPTKALKVDFFIDNDNNIFIDDDNDIISSWWLNVIINLMK